MRGLWITLAACGLLAGCRHTAPQLYPDPPPALDPPAQTSYQPTPGDCPDARGISAGEATPCGGVIVPTHQALDLLQVAEVLTPWLDDRLQLERRARLADRAQAQATYSELWDYSRATQREVTGLRIAVPVVAVLCVVVGAAVGVAAGEVVP